MQKRICLIIQGDEEMKRKEWICQSCGFEMSDQNGPMLVFNPRGLFVGLLVDNTVRKPS